MINLAQERRNEESRGLPAFAMSTCAGPRQEAAWTQSRRFVEGLTSARLRLVKSLSTLQSLTESGLGTRTCAGMFLVLTNHASCIRQESSFTGVDGWSGSRTSSTADRILACLMRSTLLVIRLPCLQVSNRILFAPGCLPPWTPLSLASDSAAPFDSPPDIREKCGD